MDKTCSVPDCGKAIKTRGYCGMHYSRLQRRGTTDATPEWRTPERMAAVRAKSKPRPKAVITCGHPDRKHGGRGMCASCFTLDWMKKNPGRSGNDWLKNNPERAKVLRRKGSLKAQYGITPEEYFALWEAQSGRCANPACDFRADAMLSDYREGLMVDHCHDTGLIRGLLCKHCNVALGHVRDDVNRLLGLVRYLESHAVI